MFHPPPVLDALRRLAGAGSADVSDADLLARYVHGHDTAAFEALVRRHGGLVWGACRRRLRDPHAAEDAFQTTFLALARHAANGPEARRIGRLAAPGGRPLFGCLSPSPTGSHVRPTHRRPGPRAGPRGRCCWPGTGTAHRRRDRRLAGTFPTDVYLVRGGATLIGRGGAGDGLSRRHGGIAPDAGPRAAARSARAPRSHDRRTGRAWTSRHVRPCRRPYRSNCAGHRCRPNSRCLGNSRRSGSSRRLRHHARRRTHQWNGLGRAWRADLDSDTLAVGSTGRGPRRHSAGRSGRGNSRARAIPPQPI